MKDEITYNGRKYLEMVCMKLRKSGSYFKFSTISIFFGRKSIFEIIVSHNFRFVPNFTTIAQFLNKIFSKNVQF